MMIVAATNKSVFSHLLRIFHLVVLIFSTSTGCAQSKPVVTIRGTSLDENELSVLIFKGVPQKSSWSSEQFPPKNISATELFYQVNEHRGSLKRGRVIRLGEGFAKKLIGLDRNGDNFDGLENLIVSPRFMTWIARSKYEAYLSITNPRKVVSDLRLWGRRWENSRVWLLCQIESGDYRRWLYGANYKYVYGVKESGEVDAVELSTGNVSEKPHLSEMFRRNIQKDWFGNSRLYVTSSGDCIVAIPDLFGLQAGRSNQIKMGDNSFNLGDKIVLFFANGHVRFVNTHHDGLPLAWVDTGLGGIQSLYTNIVDHTGRLTTIRAKIVNLDGHEVSSFSSDVNNENYLELAGWDPNSSRMWWWARSNRSGRVGDLSLNSKNSFIKFGIWNYSDRNRNSQLPSVFSCRLSFDDLLGK